VESVIAKSNHRHVILSKAISDCQAKDLFEGAAALMYTYRDTLGLADPPRDEQVENLRAFATLYGYVRYFHPSDAAARTDRDKFAIYGVRQARDAASPSALRTELEALFEPIAPTVQPYRADRETPPPADVPTPLDTAGLKLVAWQHQGIGVGGSTVPPYRSTRLHRSSSTLGDVGQVCHRCFQLTGRPSHRA
jgi:hypothetical protein